jgi:hypothetical protein
MVLTYAYPTEVAVLSQNKNDFTKIMSLGGSTLELGQKKGGSLINFVKQYGK